VTAVWALVRNDLRLYRQDRRAVVVGILVPILIAAFFGYIFSGERQGGSGRIAVAVVNEDPAPLTTAIVAALKSDTALEVLPADRAEAERLVRRGKVHVAVVIPPNLSAEATRALFTARDRPSVEFLVDPSDRMSGQVVQGLFAEHAMQEISRYAFGASHGTEALQRAISSLEARGAAAATEREDLESLRQALDRLNRHATESAEMPASALSQGLTIPYEVALRAVADPAHRDYNSYAHSFAGMSVQFILFGGIDAGVLLLLLRERGIWQRLRSAPLSRPQLLLARVIATSLISLFQFAVIYAVAMLVFKVRIGGSVAGFLGVVAAFSLLNGAFGLMLAALGRSPGATRGFAALATLLLVMVGGAWVPAFVFPQWLQQASLLSPTRWAIDGLDAMSWRGLGADAALAPVVVLLASALACLLIAVWRFRWEE
jgi:ABC-2 type transport system permease protein